MTLPKFLYEWLGFSLHSPLSNSWCFRQIVEVHQRLLLVVLLCTLGSSGHLDCYIAFIGALSYCHFLKLKPFHTL
ncbi:unnamed protein product (mitochondrion) [Musa textilis]